MKVCQNDVDSDHKRKCRETAVVHMHSGLSFVGGCQFVGGPVTSQKHIYTLFDSLSTFDCFLKLSFVLFLIKNTHPHFHTQTHTCTRKNAHVGIFFLIDKTEETAHNVV